jgi:hypothetical protein
MLPSSVRPAHSIPDPRLSARAHGILDYAAVVWFAVSPRLFGFGDASTALSLTVSLVLLLMSVTTAYPLGLLKAIPLNGHLLMDLALSAALMLSPWFFGFSPQDPGGPIALWGGIVLLTATVVTRFETQASRRESRRLAPV